MVDTLLQDLRYAARTLRRSPGFAAVAILTLALGIGATTAVYGIVHALMWRPLPFEQPDRLVVVRGVNPERGITDDELSQLDLRDFREQGTATLAGLAGITFRQASLTGPEGADRLIAWLAEPAFFGIVGARPVLGRSFTAAEAQPGGAAVVMLSHETWRHRFAGDSGIVGRSVTVNGEPHMVVGVMPASFRFVRGDLWLPLRPDDTPRDARYIDAAVGRLRPGAAVAEARTELTGIAARLASAYPVTNRGWSVSLETYRDDEIGPNDRFGLSLMLAAVAVVLLIACANVAGLMLVRASGRSRELAVRAAIGASRPRLVRQLLIESLALALAGAAVGLLLASWWNDALLATLPAEDLPPWLDVSLDLGVLAVTAAVAVAAAVLFGMLPSLRASKPELLDELKGGGRGATGPAGRLRHGLVVAQVALSVVLLASAFVFIESFLAARVGRLGFDDRGVVTARVYLDAGQRRTVLDRVAWMRAALERARQLPGVRDAALTGPIPGDDGGDRRPIVVESAPVVPGEELLVTVAPSSDRFFDMLAAPLHAGRGFTTAEAEDTAAAVAIVGETLARRLWPGADPIGRRVRLPPDTAWLRVVGVAGDLQYEEFGEDVLADRLQVHLPYARAPWRGVTVMARTTRDAGALAAPLAQALRGVDANVPVFEVRTMTQVRRETTAGQRVFVLIFGTFGAQALLMAGVGLFGVLAYGVALRRREIGVRMALGARPWGIVAMIVRQATALTGVGLAVGLAGGAAAARMLQSALWGVGGTLVPLLAVTAVLLATALLAALSPARRAVRVDPIVVLREE